VEGQSAFVGWPFSLDLGLNINKQQAENINKQQATSGKTPGRAEGPGASREGTRSKQALVYIRYILYNKDLLN